MDDHLNRAARIRRQSLLSLLLVSCAGSLSLAWAAEPLHAPQRIAAPAAQPPRDVPSSDRDPSLFVHEPSADAAALPTQGAGLVAMPSSSVSPAAVMPGYSAASLRQAAANSMDVSAARLAHRANLSAAAAATEAMHLIAQSIDTTKGDGQASAELASALVSIREAADFVGRYGVVDSKAIARMVRSHETTALKSADTTTLTGLSAADVYLDSARQTLSAIAADDPLAANAIGLLAATYRQRTAESSIALATSVHLMRAAVACSPRDQGLAMELASVLDEAQLHDESRLAYKYAMKLPPSIGTAKLPDESNDVIAIVSGSQSNDPKQTQQAVRIEQLSPAAFANVSRPEAGPVGPPTARQVLPPVTAPPVKQEGNSVSRVFKSMTQAWR